MLNHHAIGICPAWSNAGAMDLGFNIRDDEKESPSSVNKEERHLLVAAGDPCNIIQTITASKKLNPDAIPTFYVIENHPNTLVRLMILLLIIFDKESTLTLTERVQYYLEVYGNMMIRPKVHELRNNGDSKNHGLFDFAFNRFRDLDDLEEVARFISGKNSKLDIQAMWDSRLRYHFGTRYDAREDVIDWDFHMVLSKEPHHIFKQEYLRWRLTGQSLDFNEAIGLVPNKTWASKSKVKSVGENINKRTAKSQENWTYISDIVTGPFMAFGSDSEDKELLKKENGNPKYTCMHISHENLMRLTQSLYDGIQSSPNALTFRLHILPTDFTSVFLGYNAFPYMADVIPMIYNNGIIAVEQPP
ncbi:hypothetical protein BC829DRAFT_401853 [Chytridium lagenaria]|nr:hypothetical protein BC829DRAFT_401853 [Chytridium lagenaria]